MTTAAAHQLVQRLPDERLRPFIRGPYHGYVEGAAPGDRQLRTPSGNVTMILGLGSAMLHLRGDRTEPHTAFVAGLHETSTVTETAGPSFGMQVDLTPIGAYLLIGRPMSDLTNRIVELDDLFGPSTRDLIDQMRDMPSWANRFDLIDAFITRRLMAIRQTASPAVSWAWSELARTHGLARIGDIAQSVGWSRKHLIAKFREQVGLPPKAVARLLRFQRAASLATSGSSWARTALECGYYDQAHLTRDFNEFTGLTPSEFVRQPR